MIAEVDVFLWQKTLNSMTKTVYQDERFITQSRLLSLTFIHCRTLIEFKRCLDEY